jgi:Flp pilus assembly pilin Flp
MPEYALLLGLLALALVAALTLLAGSISGFFTSVGNNL